MIAPDSSAHRVLIVDDEAAIRRFAARVLLEEGFEVLEAEDGVQALTTIATGQVNAVVSDIVMPRLNGVQLMEALSISHPHLPVVLMSGYATGELVGMGIAAPCALIAKPFPPERLIEEVRRCLRGADPLALGARN
ncbi:MAG TPA: response regulator [Gemmatimonadales bacterium]|nr:response regulator [Gemmatimonadales bacterium]